MEEPIASEVKLVIVAVPPVAIGEVVARSLDKYPNATVTDVGSVKSRIATDLAKLHINLGRYVGGHPMAGSQHSGPITAVSELFVDRTWVLTPRPDNPDWVVDRARMLVRTCRARLLEMDADQHDGCPRGAARPHGCLDRLEDDRLGRRRRVQPRLDLP